MGSRHSKLHASPQRGDAHVLGGSRCESMRHEQLPAGLLVGISRVTSQCGSKSCGG
jgi:hypothetical protein